MDRGGWSLQAASHFSLSFSLTSWKWLQCETGCDKNRRILKREKQEGRRGSIDHTIISVKFYCILFPYLRERKKKKRERKRERERKRDAHSNIQVYSNPISFHPFLRQFLLFSLPLMLSIEKNLCCFSHSSLILLSFFSPTSYPFFTPLLNQMREKGKEKYSWGHTECKNQHTLLSVLLPSYLDESSYYSIIFSLVFSTLRFFLSFSLSLSSVFSLQTVKICNISSFKRISYACTTQ